jgi:LysM repeat protein
MSESLEPYEPQEAGYEWDYDEEPEGAGLPKILWGRVAALGALVVVAFLVGRLTAGGGVPQEDFDALKQERADLQQRVSTLEGQLVETREQLAAAEATNEAATVAAEEQPADTGEEETTGTATETPEGETYVIESGDSLALIAQQEYGDADYADFLAEVNGITDPSQVQAGQEIIIPDEPE